MLRQFHYIDQNGKDQGLNVRNRSKELAELLSDVDRIRAERKKSRATRNKYGGVEGGMGIGGSTSSGSRYGGFGSEDASFGGYSGGVYGDGGGFSGNTGGFSDSQSRRDRFEEYDEYDEGAVAAPGRRQPDRDPPRAGVKRETPTSKKAEPAKAKAPEVDLFSFDDSEQSVSVSASSGPSVSTASDGKAPVPADDDDEFDEFQSAGPQSAAPSTSGASGTIPPPTATSTTTNTTFAAPQPSRTAAQAPQMSDLFSTASPAPSNSGLSTPSTQTLTAPPISSSGFGAPPKSSGYQPAGPNYFTPVSSMPAVQPQRQGTGMSSSGGSGAGLTSPPLGGGQQQQQKARTAGGDPFSGLLAGTSAKKPSTPQQKGGSLADMAKQKAQAGIWNATGPPAQGSGGSVGGGGLTAMQGQGQKIGRGGGGVSEDLLG